MCLWSLIRPPVYTVLNLISLMGCFLLLDKSAIFRRSLVSLLLALPRQIYCNADLLWRSWKQTLSINRKCRICSTNRLGWCCQWCLMTVSSRTRCISGVLCTPRPYYYWARFEFNNFLRITPFLRRFLLTYCWMVYFETAQTKWKFSHKFPGWTIQRLTKHRFTDTM